MKLLFVCTGNTCRSPMAQALAEKVLSEKGIPARCDSAGIYAIPGQKTAENAITVLKKYFGIDSSSHSAKPCTKELLEESDLVIAMTENHKTLLCQKFGCENKTITLPMEVGDPFGGDEALYKRSADLILAGIEKLIRNGVIHD